MAPALAPSALAQAGSGADHAQKRQSRVRAHARRVSDSHDGVQHISQLRQPAPPGPDPLPKGVGPVPGAGCYYRGWSAHISGGFAALLPGPPATGGTIGRGSTMEDSTDAGPSRRANVVAAFVTMFVSATMAVGLRLYTRVKFLGGLKVEDYLILGAWVRSASSLVVTLSSSGAGSSFSRSSRLLLLLGLSAVSIPIPLLVFPPCFPLLTTRNRNDAGAGKSCLDPLRRDKKGIRQGIAIKSFVFSA